jgi:hypothetical protein
VAAFIAISAVHGIMREYRFEVAVPGVHLAIEITPSR